MRLRTFIVKVGKQSTKQEDTNVFYINPKAGHYYEFTLPPGFQVKLPKNLARALGYLNHEDRVLALYLITGPTSVELNEDQSVTLKATTITMRRNDELLWGILSRHSFQSMYIYSDLIESLVVGDVQANLLRTIVPRGRPGDMIAEEIKIPTYHRLRTSIFSALEINIRGDTGQLISFASGVVPVLPEDSAHAIMMETPPDSKRKTGKRRYKPRTPFVTRLRSNKQWEPY